MGVCLSGGVNDGGRYYGNGGRSCCPAMPGTCRERTGHRTWPVGQKRPNDFGLFDMHGNVWEMVLGLVRGAITTANSPRRGPARSLAGCGPCGPGRVLERRPALLLVGGPEQGRTGRPEPLPGVSRRPSPVRSLSQGRLGAEPGAEAGGGDEEFLFSPRRRR